MHQLVLLLQALDLDANNVKALFRRGQANGFMKDYDEAMVSKLYLTYITIAT